MENKPLVFTRTCKYCRNNFEVAFEKLGYNTDSVHCPNCGKNHLTQKPTGYDK